MIRFLTFLEKFSPQLHPRVVKGRKGGGRFAAKPWKKWVKSPKLKKTKDVSFSFTEEEFKKKLPGKVKVMDDPYSGSHYMTVQGDGIKKFQMTYFPKDVRRTNHSPNSIYLDWVEVENNDKGREAARKIMQAVYDTAIGIGVPKIDLSTGLESGGYVWARMGFQITNVVYLNNGELRERMERANDNGLEPNLAEKVKKIIEVDTGRENVKLAHLDNEISESLYNKIINDDYVLNLGKKRHGKTTLGKALLLGTHYNATMPKRSFGNIEAWVKKFSPEQHVSEVFVVPGTIMLSELIFEIMNREEQ